jgi:hypothetical protein
MRGRTFGLAVLLALLAACDAGHPEPGSDNRAAAAGPVLEITTPRPGQTVPGPRVDVMFDVRDADHREVRVTVDGGAERAVTDVTVPLRLEGLAPGEHVVKAGLVDAAGKPVAGPRATATVSFTVRR